MVYFIGAGPGAADLITLRGAEQLKTADVVIYAGSLVNPELLKLCGPETAAYDSSAMTLEQIIEVIRGAEAKGQTTARLHTGDPSLYGAIREQMDALDTLGIPYIVTPGVSSFSAAAAALTAEYTLPGVSQTLILSRMAGRTPVPERESISELASHGASMALFLSAGLLRELQEELLNGAYTEDTPAAIVYRASWPDERLLPCTVGSLAETGERNGIRKTALILVGDFLYGSGERSCLYHPDFSTMYRKAEEGEGQ